MVAGFEPARFIGYCGHFLPHQFLRLLLYQLSYTIIKPGLC